jgi:colanic acid biosynthesis glycosyl transferase WcaI
MRLLIHDFAGHPFAAELSRELAREGHEVTHAFCGGVTTGRGALERLPGDPPSLRFVDVSDRPFERYAPVGRIKSEALYGRAVATLVRTLRPDAVLSANCPVLAQAQLWRACRRAGARRVFWLQDFLGHGTRAVLASKSKLLGSTFGRAWEGLETRLLRGSDAIVAISADFVAALDARGVHVPVQVVENWTPISEVTARSKANPWSIAAGLAERPVALYSGTLGLKHDPEHLVAVAVALASTDMAVAVVTEGIGRAHLEARRQELELYNLFLFDFVDYEELPEVLGAADVCLVLLEPEAGAFSVPSKVLTYLSAGRAIVGAIPAENLASRTIRDAGAGVVVTPGDHNAFAAATRRLLADPLTTAAMGRAGRQHAERTFTIGPIAERISRALGAT